MRFKRLLVYLGNTIIFLALANAGKLWIFSNLLGRSFTDTNAFLSLVYVRNDGAAFNFFAGQNEFLIICAVLIIVYFIIYLLTYKLYLSENFLMLLSFFSAGIIGNLYERITLQYVEDFIKINLYDFPVFNINDILITVGAVFLSLIVINDKYSEYKEIKDVTEDDLYREL